MESLYFLVPGALIFIAIAVKILFWAINNGQYDNLDTEAHRILFDDEKRKAENAERKESEKVSNAQNVKIKSDENSSSTATKNNND